MTLLYAAYGSNLAPLRLQRRIAAAKFVGTAHIANRALRFHKRGQDGSGKCSIVTADDGLHVAIYAMSGTAKARLDRIEGVGRGYEVAALSVDGYGQCFTYLAADTHVDERLEPFAWYRELVLSGAEYHGFPALYRKTIEAVRVREDPDAGRHRRHMHLAQLLRKVPIASARPGADHD